MFNELKFKIGGYEWVYLDNSPGYVLNNSSSTPL